MFKFLLCLSILFFLAEFTDLASAKYHRTFPDDFVFGVGSSSYQIEGGWNQGGKGESVWDYLTHNRPDEIPNQDNGDISADSFHFFERDVEMVRELNANIYRFSISWPRILPTGLPHIINKEGIHYYNRLIDECLRQNITPMVTIYHWELPQRIQELGGWANAEIVNYFRDYAEIVFQHFGDRVKIWTTINEPLHICEEGYGLNFMAPALDFPGVPNYLCGHNLLKAHAEVVHMYREVFQSTQNGKIGITADTSWMEPKTDSAEDKQASEMALQFYLGWFMHPIFSKTGDYPQLMIDQIAAMSKQQGYRRSRLPKFTDDEILRIHNTSDFFGVNTYTTSLVTRNDANNTGNFQVPSFPHDMGVIESMDATWPESGSPWLRPVPFGMYKLLMWIRDEYDNPPVFVTENGVSDKGGLNDVGRVHYYNSYLQAVLDAIEDDCNVRGYMAWSLMDSFEWKAGYTEKFGLFHVNFTSPERTRTPKLSAKVFANIAKTHTIDWLYSPTQSTSSTPQISSASTVSSSLVVFIGTLFCLPSMF